DNDQLAVDALHPLHGKEERMADCLDVLNGLQFLFGRGAGGVEGATAALNELDRLEQTARRLALPHLAEAAAPQRFEQAVAWNRLQVRRFGVPRTFGSRLLANVCGLHALHP